ncbi:hypothetical protein [Tunturibacter empetritectus]|uniref:Uncharacterized protein n=1 Tax=Tunturiibacter lichenicola TaxID=2051959 RepID=A0A7W8N3D1_9BACT|nr:hypothetical protein [Edaphobacter lichenicola]MBB5343338.1 hypothetical protein [Edaphobacter lichenicola]
MAKGTRQSELRDEDRALRKALLFEVSGHMRADQGKEGRTLRIAALSLEEVICYMRTGHSDFEIAEVKVVGQIEVLSTSEHLG